MTEPTHEEFLRWLRIEHPEVLLNDNQVEMASAILDYEKKLFSYGLRSGRTFTINLVREYIESNYGAVLHRV